jgi:hypothetical protein
MEHEAVLQIILPHAREPKLLLQQDGGWTMPRLELEFAPGASPFRFFSLGMKTQSVLGCQVAMLRCAYFEPATDDHGYRCIFVAENLDPDFQPPTGTRWFTYDELNGIVLNDEYLRAVVETYVQEAQTKHYPEERPSWAFPGWWAYTSDWIRAQVKANGWRLEGEIELVRKWSITCVMKAPTSVGDLYFKAVPPMMAREVEVTWFLAEQFPDYLPSIVAYDTEQRWLLMRDFGQTFLVDSKEVADWERVLREFSALQIAMVPQVDTLVKLNALHYPVEQLPDGLEALLADTEYLHPDRHMSQEEIERVRSYLPQIRQLAEELTGYDIPLTILHGDFHSGNTAIQDQQIIFFDWTDVMVGCPLLDMAFFFDGVGEVLGDAPETTAQLRETYLEGLSSLAPIDVLRRALPLAQTMGFLQLVVHYHDLLSRLEPSERWTLEVIGFFMKQMLMRLETVHHLSPTARS